MNQILSFRRLSYLMILTIVNKTDFSFIRNIIELSLLLLKKLINFTSKARKLTNHYTIQHTASDSTNCVQTSLCYVRQNSNEESFNTCKFP